MIKCRLFYMGERNSPIQLELPFDKRVVRKWWQQLPPDCYVEFVDYMQARWVNSRARWNQKNNNGQAVLRGSKLFKIASYDKVISKMRIKYG